MRIRVATTYVLDPGDKFIAVDHPALQSVSIMTTHPEGFYVQLLPEHIPGLLKAAKVLLQYATLEQQTLALGEMRKMFTVAMVDDPAESDLDEEHPVKIDAAPAGLHQGYRYE